jgi:hypothetical protein
MHSVVRMDKDFARKPFLIFLMSFLGNIVTDSTLALHLLQMLTRAPEIP